MISKELFIGIGIVIGLHVDNQEDYIIDRMIYKY